MIVRFSLAMCTGAIPSIKAFEVVQSSQEVPKFTSVIDFTRNDIYYLKLCTPYTLTNYIKTFKIE